MPYTEGEVEVAERPRVFISYSFKDGEWRRRILNYLERAKTTIGGFEIGDDALIGEGAGWASEVGQQVSQPNAAILLISPNYLGSEEIRNKELPELLSRRTATGLQLIPLLVEACDWRRTLPWLESLQVYPQNRQPLSGYAPDEMAKVLEDVVKVIRRPATMGFREKPAEKRREDAVEDVTKPKKQGALYGVPELPRVVLTPTALFAKLKASVLGEKSTPAVVGIGGVGGIGKTVLAASLARDEEIRRSFSDGVFWVTMGQNPNIFSLQKRLVDGAEKSWGKTTGHLARSFGPLTPLNMTEVLRHDFDGRRVLLILDDAWSEDHVASLNVVSASGRLVITTRKTDLIRNLHAIQQDVGALSADDALRLLAESTGTAVSNLPEAAEDVATMCGNIPLGLTLVGAMIRREGGTDIAWHRVLTRLRESNAHLSDARSQPQVITFLSAESAISASIAGLAEETRNLLLDLAGFPQGVAIPIAAISQIWRLSDPRTRELLRDLASSSLLRLDSGGQTIEIDEPIQAYLRWRRPNAPSIDVDLLLKSSQRLVSLSADSEEGEDLLDIKQDVEAFSAVLASKDLRPPLCIGIFGDWGSGKSFFMRKMQDRIKFLCEQSEEAEKEKRKTAFCSQVAQITFNAWHYVDANLWASLACRIFEGLDKFIEGENKQQRDAEAQKAQLFKKLESARQRLEEAKQVSKDAQQEKNAAETKLEQLQQDRQNKSLELEQVRAAAVKLALNNQSTVRDELQKAAKEMGLQGLTDNLGKFDQALNDLQNTSGRIRALWLALANGKDRWMRIGFLVGLIALIPLLGIGVQKLLNYWQTTGILARFGALVGEVSTVVALVTAWLTRSLRRAGEAVDRVDRARKKVDEVLVAAKAHASPEEAKVQKELVVLKEQESSARSALKEAQEKVDQAEKEKHQLEERSNGKVLAEFIRERVRGTAYQSQLGIISSIRKDLHSLSDLLAESQHWRESGSAEGEPTTNRDPNLPRIDRIILYIDDLDRCPEKIVVEVLQAIHLLLAFPLFIVVIGVDSRWLLQSLRHYYTTLHSQTDNKLNYASDSTYESGSTPQNYLEKIIQVPFNLRRMDKDGFRRLMKNILPCEEPTVVQEATRKESPGAEPQAPAELFAQGGEPQATQNPTNKPFEEKPVTAQDVPDGERRLVDLEPEALKITPRELEFLAGLAALTPTPRAGKRMANVYRLLRAGVPPADLPRLLGNEKTPGEYTAVMALLAIQVGFPMLANDVFSEVRANPSKSWKGIQEDYYRRLLPDATGTIFDKSEPTILREKGRLSICLKVLADHKELGGSLKPYGDWTKRVSRYSFRGLDDELTIKQPSEDKSLKPEEGP
jgi:hypothetical protein